MRELLHTTDPVLLSFAAALLKGEDIETVVFDNNISLMEGSIGAFPQRLVVDNSVWERARRVLLDSGLGAYVVEEPSRDH